MLLAAPSVPGVGVSPPHVCPSGSLREARQAFREHYKAKRFGQAVAALEPAFRQCEDTLPLDERARILSDLAIAAFRGGDRKLCLRFIDRVPSKAPVSTSLAFAIENNRRMCTGEGSTADVPDCRQTQTTDEESLCAAQILEGAHKQLRRVLKAAEDKLRTTARGSVTEWIKELRRANQASLKLIEHDCGPLFTLEFGPWGTGFNSEQSECESSRIKLWTQEIQNHFALPGYVAEKPAQLGPCSAASALDCPAVREVEKKREARFKTAINEKPQTYEESELTASQQIAEWRKNTRLHEKLWLAWREAWCVSSLAAELEAREGTDSKTLPVDAQAACLVRVTDVASEPKQPAPETAKAKPLAISVPAPTCTNLPPDSGVHLDGLYQDQGEGGWPPTSWSYLRFYADGTVLAAGSTRTPQDVARWLDKSHKDNRTGCATAKSGTIRIVEAFSDGSMEYSGTVKGNDLVLHVVRRSTGYQADKTYRFIPMHFEPGAGAASSSPHDGSKIGK
jgi:hypothetical protein